MSSDATELPGGEYAALPDKDNKAGKKEDTTYEAAANARLLLHEVLLDEYDNLEQPSLFNMSREELVRMYPSSAEDYRAKEGGEQEEQFQKFRHSLFKVLGWRYKDPRYASMCSPDCAKYVDGEVVLIKEYLSEQSVREAAEGDGSAKPSDEEKKRREGAAKKRGEWLKTEEGLHWLESRVDEELVREFMRLMYAALERGAREKLGPGASQKDVRAEAQTLRSALCLSGGGIRSATYNLGAIQGLARHGLLDKFDYLSTVSGGGFIGGWLTAWIHRQSLDEVVKKLSKRPASPLKPDPPPVDHLRVYSNFLSPRPGLLSADTWTLISSVTRNLLLTWLVFMPVLVAMLLLPRMFVSLACPTPGGAVFDVPLWFVTVKGVTVWFIVALVAAMWGFTYTGFELPTVAGVRDIEIKKGGQGRFILFNLLPLVVAAAAAALDLRRRLLSDDVPGVGWFIGLAILVMLIPMLLSIFQAVRKSPRAKGRTFVKGLLALACVTGAQFLTGYLLWLAASSLPHGMVAAGDVRGGLLYATLAPPVILLLMSLGAVFIAGFTSRVTDDADQEWWARSGAWILIVCLLWAGGHLLVVYGPLLFIWAGEFVWDVSAGRELTWGGLAKNVGPVLAAVVSGAFTLLGGFSAGTPANEKEAKRAGIGGKVVNLLTGLLAPIFLAFVLIFLALLTNLFLMKFLPPRAGLLALSAKGYPNALDSATHIGLLRHTGFLYLVGLAALLLGVSAFFGRIVNTNAFSLHHMWRDRIIRAYLGASRARRNPNRFTGFDPADNVQMHQLREQRPWKRGEWRETLEPENRFKNVVLDEEKVARNPKGKLLHVINVALNLTGGDKLAWQDRKAESMTVSPLHAGSYWLGYRRTWKYGSYGAREGISLGTAVAISGAFVSPNMGYMMTSPVVRFLMTLFNVRFGWWLGNPGRSGDKDYKLEWPLKQVERLVCRLLGIGELHGFNLRSPRLSVLPIVEEAFGHTNDKSPYVYLSDGGHFENLGLYEMVLRRCRYIVVCDASTDADYSFDSLAMAIRQIRVDFGIPIVLPDLTIGAPSKDFRNKYCAVGRIRYSCVDRDPRDQSAPSDDDYYDGVLVYIKPALVGSEPRDVATYGLGSDSFPQEVIVDQWFSEAQFESYRELASHAINEICRDESNKVDFRQFKQLAEEHNQLDFRAYDEEIQYSAFEHMFKQEMGPVAPSSFKARARDSIKRILD
ncbi:MAG TPA: patatin-like phospholipase family protein [Pyrinomonadaceae bacterium]|nr:patatin-like phospholipase family protein [Pyrinomonadaceae bacterium]